MNITVYILSCAHGFHYTGMTNNIDRRLKEHNSGRSYWTSQHLPVSLIHSESFETRRAARTKEKAIKKQGAARYLQMIAIKKQFSWIGEIR
jgi:putative endonuclease